MAIISGPSVPAMLRYLRPEKRTVSDAEGKALEQAADLGTRATVLENTREEAVQVVDARAAAARSELSLATNGFVLLRHQTRCPHFRDIDSIQKHYYPEVIELVKELTGAAHVLVAAHSVRMDRAELAGSETNSSEEMRALLKKGGGPYANFTHIDTNNFFAREAPRRFARLAADIPDPYTKGIGTGGSNAAVLPLAGLEAGYSPEQAATEFEFMDYSVWQPIDREVLQNPLALLDARSISPQMDLAPCNAGGTWRFGGITGLLPNPGHRWCYFSRMQTDELLVFRGMKHPQDGLDPDGAPKPGVPGSGLNVPHISFTDPTVPADAPGRRSIECRVLAAFPKKKEEAVGGAATVAPAKL